MAVDLKSLKNHPGRNPDYEAGMKARLEAQEFNRSAKAHNLVARATGARKFALIPVPKQPNKYVPHQGAKEQSRA